MKTFFPIFLFSLIISSCGKYYSEDIEKQKDYIPSFFSYDSSLSEDWKLFDVNNQEVKIDQLKISRGENAKIIKAKIIVSDGRTKFADKEVYLWYGGVGSDSGYMNSIASTPPKNLVNIINFIKPNEIDYIYPSKNHLKDVWYIPKQPFSYELIGINSNQYLIVEKKESYIINKKSFIEDKKTREYGIFGNTYDSLTFSRDKSFVRMHIEAISEKDNQTIIKFDSGYEEIRKN